MEAVWSHPVVVLLIVGVLLAVAAVGVIYSRARRTAALRRALQTGLAEAYARRLGTPSQPDAVEEPETPQPLAGEPVMVATVRRESYHRSLRDFGNAVGALRTSILETQRALQQSAEGLLHCREKVHSVNELFAETARSHPLR